MLLEVRRDGDRLPGQQRATHSAAQARSPSSSMRASGCSAIGCAGVPGERPAEIVPVAAHRKRGRADRAAEVEGEDLRTWIAPELQRHQRQQHALAGTRRAHHQGVADVADMEGEAKRRRPFRPREEQRRRIEMLVPFRPGPHRREGHHVGQVEGRDRRLADIGIDMARQASEPGFDRVDRLAHAGEVAALDGLLHEPKTILSNDGILVPDGHGRGDVGLGHDVGAQLLQGEVGIVRLVGGVGVQQDRGLAGHHLLQDRHDRLALGKPLTADAPQHLGGIGLVEADGARGPPIGKGQPVQVVEQTRPGLRRKAHDGERPQMRPTETRFQPAGDVLIDQDGVEMHRSLGHPDALAAGSRCRNAGK